MVRDFRNQVAPVYCRFPQSRRTCNQFQLRACTVTCTPPPNFSTNLAFFREWFLWRLGGRSPPLGYATAEKNLLDHVQYLSLVYCFCIILYKLAVNKYTDLCAVVYQFIFMVVKLTKPTHKIHTQRF